MLLKIDYPFVSANNSPFHFIFSVFFQISKHKSFLLSQQDQKRFHVLFGRTKYKLVTSI